MFDIVYPEKVIDGFKLQFLSTFFFFFLNNACYIIYTQLPSIHAMVFISIQCFGKIKTKNKTRNIVDRKSEFDVTLKINRALDKIKIYG